MKKPRKNAFDPSPSKIKPEKIDLSGIPGFKPKSNFNKIPLKTNSDTVTPRHRDTTIPSNRDTTTPDNQTEISFESIRKDVKKIGKEAGTHRLTPEEKDKVLKTVFYYTQKGYKTSENEIVRVGLNWLLEDHKINKESSVLHQVLKLLKE